MLRILGFLGLLGGVMGGGSPVWGQAPELGRIGPKAAAVLHIRAGGIYAGPSMKYFRDIVAQAGPLSMQILEERFQITPFQIDRITTVAMMPDLMKLGQPPVAVMVTTLIDIKTEGLAERLEIHGVKDETAAFPFWRDGDLGLAVPEPRLLIFGDKGVVEALAKALPGPIAPLWSKLANDDVSLVVNLETLPEQLAEFLPPPFPSLAKAKQLSATLNLEGQAKLRVEVRYADDRDAKVAEEVIRDLLRKGLSELEGPRKQMLAMVEKPGAPRPGSYTDLPEAMAGMFGLAAINHAEKLLLHPPFKQIGPILSAEITAPPGFPTALVGVGGLTLFGMAVPAVSKVQSASGRMQSANNLKQMGIAFHNYTDTWSHFPANIVDKNTGKPLLSWRVALLPYIEQNALYKAFKQDEPWDSEHNIKLAKSLVPVYSLANQTKRDPQGNCLTPYQAFTGQGTLFEAGKKVRFTDVRDGTSNTLLFVEAKNQVIWSKPDDIPFDPAKELLAANTFLGGLFPGGFNAAFCDGSVRFIGDLIDTKTLKLLITRSDGQVIDFDKLNPPGVRGPIDSTTPPKPMTTPLAPAENTSPLPGMAANRIRSMNNLKQMGLAFHNFHDTNGHFPANIVDKNTGKPLLSWRVALLPYIEQNALYKAFKQDEPWDSEHNIKLAKSLVPVYSLANQTKRDPQGNCLTPYQAFTGKSTLFEAGKKLKFTDVTDGTSNTLLFVEAKNQVIWSKPDDISFDPAKELLAANTFLGGLFPGGFNAAFCDGSVRFIGDLIDTKTLKLLITRSDGQVIDFDKLNPPGVRGPIDSTTPPKPMTTPLAPAENTSPLPGMAANRIRSMNNLKQMGLAFHNFADVNGHFPANIVDKNTGKPLLSWRVALLPYIDQNALYKAFKQDEPWDSEHNIKLAKSLVPVYSLANQTKRDPQGNCLTPYQAFTGKSTLFEAGKKLKFTDVTDGTSNTLLFVEAKNQVIWSKPDDIPFDPAKELPAANTFLGGLFPGGFHAAFCDGSVRFFKDTIDSKTIQAMITRAGEEVLP